LLGLSEIHHIHVGSSGTFTRCGACKKTRLYRGACPYPSSLQRPLITAATNKLLATLFSNFSCRFFFALQKVSKLFVF
jgi:hypothetical protein